MAFTYYSEYAAHAMRFYARNRDRPDTFCRKADALNWECCEKTLSQFDKKSQEILLNIYASKSTFPASIMNASRTFSIQQSAIWNLNNDFLVRFSQNRDLI